METQKKSVFNKEFEKIQNSGFKLNEFKEVWVFNSNWFSKVFMYLNRIIIDS